MRKYIKAVIMLLLPVLPAGCNSRIDVRIENSVKYIDNKQIPVNNARLKLIFKQKFGSLSTNDENYQLYKPGDAVADKWGNIYILDSGNCRIQKYSRDGKYLLSIGKRGQGPGELEAPGTMDIYGDSLLYLTDRRLIEKFYLDGKWAGSFPGPGYTPFLRKFSNGEWICKSYEIFQAKDSEPDKSYSLIRVISSDENKKVRTIGQPYLFPDTYKSLSANNIHVAIGPDDCVYVAFENLNRVDKYEMAGKYLLSASRPLKFTALEEPEKVMLGPHRKQPYEYRYRPVSRDIAVDGKNRIWVLTANRDLNGIDSEKQIQEGAENIYDFHVFDSEGVLLAVIPAEFPWYHGHVRIFGSRMFVTEHRDVMCVHEYAIVEEE